MTLTLAPPACRSTRRSCPASRPSSRRPRSRSSPSCTAPSSRAAQELLAARAERAKRARRGRAARLPRRDRGDPRRRLEDRAGAAGAALPPRRDHRPGRRQDGHQRLQLGRRLVHDRLRGLELADVDEPDPGPDQHRPGDPAHALVRAVVAGGNEELQAQRQGRDAAGPPARLAPRREARDDRRRSASPAASSTSRLFMFHNAKEQLARGAGPYFYLPKLESHLEARLWNDDLRDDAERARPAAGHDQGDGADRDHPRRLRDGRDPLRAARPLGRPQRRPLGLHLQLHQEVQPRPRLLPRRPRQGDDDGAVHARLRAAAAEDLPPARRAGDRRHERADPDQERSGEERGRRWPGSSPTSGATRPTATTAAGSRTRGWSRRR